MIKFNNALIFREILDNLINHFQIYIQYQTLHLNKSKKF